MGKSKGVSQDFFNFIKPAQIPSYIEPTKQTDFLHVSENNFFVKFDETPWDIIPLTYRGKNAVLLVCFPKIFFPLT